MAVELVVIAGSAFFIGLTGAVTPGPLLALDIRESLRVGVRAGILVSTGHAIADLIMLLLLIVGMDQIPDSDSLVSTIGIIGGIFLVWMGVHTFRTMPKTLPWEIQANTNSGGQWLYPSLNGLAVTFSNPYFIVWWVTVGNGFLLAMSSKGIAETSAFYVGHILADYAWFVGVAAAVGSGRRFLNRRSYTIILKVSSIFLAGIGVAFLSIGLRVLFK